ncbi:MAG TPA: type II toxin-antitoxin system RelE/ParE family toxin [Ramlibacter sp.]|jgi:mRNA-degrading endonuclease RelE of RelBE toxin-antitoxin system|nr:type II toxin-antitoxin system RelE/ParE family toxin [Ramlibacter sp.]
MNTIYWQPKALKQVRKLPKSDRLAISRAVDDELMDLSNARNVKKLADHPYAYRLRVGNWRVFFEFDGAIRIVTVEEVRKRDEQTY